MLKKQVKNLIGSSFLLHVSLLRVWGSCRAWATCQRAEEETFFRLSRLTSCRGRVNESRLLMSTVCFGKTGSRRRKDFRTKAWKSSQSWRGGLVPEPSQSQNSLSWNAYTRRDFVSLWNSSVENQRIFLFFVFCCLQCHIEKGGCSEMILQPLNRHLQSMWQIQVQTNLIS